MSYVKSLVKTLLRILGWSTDEKRNGISAFFTVTPAKERKKVIKRAVEGANRDQKDLVRKYNLLTKSQ